MSDSAQTTPVAQANLGLPQTSPNLPAGAVAGGRPEAKADSAIMPETPAAPVEIEIIPDAAEVSPELAEHVEAVERGEVHLPGPINAGIHEGQQVTIQPAISQQPNIILPLTQDDFVAGAKKPVSSSFRWLHEFVKRIILMMPGRTVYRN